MNLDETFNNNMNLLKEGWPVVYKEVLEADISEYELIPVKSDEYNIAINGNKLYPENMKESISNQVDEFIQKPTTYFKKPAWSKITNRNYLHDDFIVSVEKDSPYVKENIPFTDYTHNLNGYFPLLLCFGIGSGKHIEELIKKSNGITDIIIIDQSYEFLKISFHLVDWRPIFHYFYKNNKGLHFVINNNYSNVSNSILNVIFKYYPYHFYNLPYLTHYSSIFFENVKKEFLSKINLGFTGLGFYDDEIDGLDHTIENINNKRAIYKNNFPLQKESSAFIIASGPSLDDDIENIKKHQKNAVIFSCGTSLKVLYKNGITPDFHIEQERTKDIIKNILVDNLPEEYLKSINLISLNVVEPPILELFKSANIYFRENDAGSSIVPDDIPKLDHCNPTVTNATISLTSDMGFKQIFLFGADMGFLDSDNHHSKDTIYYNKNQSKIPLNINKSTYPGNFDSNVRFLSTDILFWCKQRAENCIKDYNEKRKENINYFNCSNGLKINGTQPLHSNNIIIDTRYQKENILETIHSKFDSNFDELLLNIKEKSEKEKAILLETIVLVKKLIKSKKIKSYEQYFILIRRTFNIINEPNSTKTALLTRSILKGTIYHFYTSSFTHALAGTSHKDSLKYINQSLIKLLSFLDTVSDKISTYQIQ